ncbi:MAG: phage tail protein [Lachnospiraceae bacterium]
MPQPFHKAILTEAGQQLLIKSQAGEANIEFTRLVIGNGLYAENEKEPAILQKMTELKSEKNSYALSGIFIHSQNSVKITALITNQDAVTKETLVTEGYFINEMGLYAKEKGKEEEEILYSIAVTSGENGDFLPIYNGFPAEIYQEYYVIVSNSVEVSIQSNLGAPALVDDLQSHVLDKNIHITEEEREKWSESVGIKRIRNLGIDMEQTELTLVQLAKFIESNIKSGTLVSAPIYRNSKFSQELEKEFGFHPDNTGSLLFTKNILGDIHCIISEHHIEESGNYYEGSYDGYLEQIVDKINFADKKEIENIYLQKTGDSRDNIVTFISNDKEDMKETQWKDVPAIKSGDTHATLFKNISGMLQNVRFLRVKQNESEEFMQETYLTKTGDSTNNTTTFTSADTANPTSWTNVSVLTSGEKHSSILNKISTMLKNMRYFYKMLGTTSISSIGGGTVTGAISTINNNLSTWETLSISETYSGFKYTGGLMKYHPILKLAFISVTIQATVATTTGVKIDMCKFNKIPSVNTALSARSPNTAGQAVNVAIFTDGTLSLSTDKAIPKEGYILCSGIYPFT